MYKNGGYIYLLWLIIFILIPLLLVVYFSITIGDSINFSEFIFSLENYKKLAKPVYLKTLYKSIKLGLLSSIISLFLGYPLAYIIAKEERSVSNFLLILLMIPMWMNFLLRTYAWLTLLGKNGIINNLLVNLGLEKKKLIYTETAVLMGTIYNYLPFMVLPIHSVLIKIDKELLEAAKDLGATNLEVFKRIVFPLSVPGIITGFTMVFIPAISTFAISSLLGGNKYNLIGNIIEQQFRYTGDWHFGSSFSIVLLVVILIIIKIIEKFNLNEGR